MTVDRKLLRQLVTAFRPDMTVEVRVRDLGALLDEIERLEKLVEGMTRVEDDNRAE